MMLYAHTQRIYQNRKQYSTLKHFAVHKSLQPRLHSIERQTKPILRRPVLQRQTATAATTAAHGRARLFELYFTRRPVDRISVQASQLIVSQGPIQLRVLAQYLVVVAIQIDLVVRSEFDDDVPARLRQIVGRAELIVGENRRIARIHLSVE